ncbi:MAG: putative signal transducing protein, partial [bacterium]
MKRIYSAANPTEANIVVGMLQAEGIDAHLTGHYLQGGVGE